MNRPDEFDYGDTLPDGFGARSLVVLVFGVFLIGIFGTAIADTLFPVSGIQLFGQERAEQKSLDQQASLWDGTLAKRFEYRLRGHSRVRAAVLPTYAYLQFLYLDEASDGVLVGKDHWLFLEHRVDLGPQPDEFLAGSLTSVVIAMDRVLAAAGVELTVLPIPRKSTIAKRFLPEGVDGHPAIDDLIIDRLVEQGVSTADMRAEYGVDDPEQIYYKLDTHWTPVAAKLAAEEVARVAGLLKPPAERLGNLEVAENLDATSGGLGMLASIGVKPSGFDLGPLNLRLNPKVVQTYSPGLAKWFVDGTGASPYMHVGTSFSEGRTFAHMLSYYVGAPVVDEAQKAQPFMSTLHRGLVRARRMGGLKHLSWEIPIGVAYSGFNAIGGSFPLGSSDSFMAVPVGTRLEVGRFLPTWERLDLKDPVQIESPRLQFLNIPSGIVGHSGDGVLSLSVKGKAWGSGLAFEYQSSYLTLRYRVKDGPFDLHIPVLTSKASSAPILLRIVSDQSVKLRVDKVVLEHIPVGTEHASLMPVKGSAGKRFKPRKPVQLGRRAALVLESKLGKGQRGRVTVTAVTSAPVGTYQVSFDEMYSGGSIVLDLGALGGGQLKSISVEPELEGFIVTKVLVTGLVARK